jgi:hypothetical protein
MIKTVGSSESLVPISWTTRCHVPKECNVDTVMLSSYYTVSLFFFQLSDLETGSVSYMRQQRARKHILIGSLAELVSDFDMDRNN